MKTLVLIILTLWTLSGCGSNTSSSTTSLHPQGEADNIKPPQPQGIADDIKPPASPDI